MRYTGPKRRLSKREGIALFKKDEKYIERKGAVPPGQRGTKVRPRITGYGTQLREKQKAKRIYGLAERQFRKTFNEAAKRKSATGETFLQLLELRLDNVIYRLGFAKSRPEARQYVSHGHVTVDSKKVNIPSFRVKTNQVVAISDKFVHNTQIAKNLSEDIVVPEWLEKKATVGKVVRLPYRDEMEKAIQEQLIVEYYSR
jgi:small subunit ribosomal protein S4